VRTLRKRRRRTCSNLKGGGGGGGGFAGGGERNGTASGERGSSKKERSLSSIAMERFSLRQEGIQEDSRDRSTEGKGVSETLSVAPWEGEKILRGGRGEEPLNLLKRRGKNDLFHYIKGGAFFNQDKKKCRTIYG